MRATAISTLAMTLALLGTAALGLAAAPAHAQSGGQKAPAQAQAKPVEDFDFNAVSRSGLTIDPYAKPRPARRLPDSGVTGAASAQPRSNGASVETTTNGDQGSASGRIGVKLPF